MSRLRAHGVWFLVGGLALVTGIAVAPQRTKRNRASNPGKPSVMLVQTRQEWAPNSPPALDYGHDSSPAEAAAPAAEVETGVAAQDAVASLAETDPAAATHLATILPRGRGREQLLLQAICQWSARDFAAAWQWATTRLDGETSATVLRTLLLDLAHTDPDLAAAFALSRPPGALRGDLAARVATGWAKIDLEAATTWAQGLPDVNDRSRAVHAAASVWADQ